MNTPYVVPLRSLGRADVELVGGKNSSLGEMLKSLGALGVTVTQGHGIGIEARHLGGVDPHVLQEAPGMAVRDTAIPTPGHAVPVRIYRHANATGRDACVGLHG